MSIKYFGQKEKLNVPLTPPVGSVSYDNYISELVNIDGVIAALEDYLTVTNPRFKNMFPEAVFNAIPTLQTTTFTNSVNTISQFKGYTVQQKLWFLSSMNFDWKGQWYLDAISFPDWWDDEVHWLFLQDLSDIIMSLMQNLGTSYKSSEDTTVILELLENTRLSITKSFIKIKDYRGSMSIPDNDKLKFWLAFMDLSIQGYIDTLELMKDYFVYCQENKSLPAEPFV